MVINTKVGFYEFIKNINDAFDESVFSSRYLEEYFDHYEFIVGDLSSNVLRLKGFNSSVESNLHIPEYILESCSFRCPYFIVKRITEDDYNRLNDYYKSNKNNSITVKEEKQFTLIKVPFDRDSLILENSVKQEPNIILNMQNINKVSKFELPLDLKDDKSSNKQSNKTFTDHKSNHNKNTNHNPNQNASKNNHEKNNSNHKHTQSKDNIMHANNQNNSNNEENVSNKKQTKHYYKNKNKKSSGN
ncbi:MAG: YutD-like domain-containing protein [Anaeroplasmataceae bacterium]